MKGKGRIRGGGRRGKGSGGEEGGMAGRGGKRKEVTVWDTRQRGWWGGGEEEGCRQEDGHRQLYRAGSRRTSMTY